MADKHDGVYTRSFVDKILQLLGKLLKLVWLCTATRIDQTRLLTILTFNSSSAVQG